MRAPPSVSTLWSSSRQWFSSGVGRIVGIGLAVLIGFQALYLLAANIVLAYFLSGWVTTSNLKLDYESASSWWPGRVHIEELSIRSHDYNIQFQIDIEEARVNVALHRLPFREFSGSDVSADGVRFKLRHNVHSLETAKRRLDAFPPIDGYPDPPVYKEPPPPPVPEEEDKRFTIELTSVDAKVLELWFLEYRYQGDARATGGFRLRPGRALRLDPATLNLNGGALTLGERTVSGTTHLKATAEIDAPDLEQLPGKAIFGTISATMDGTFEGGDLDFANTYLPLDNEAKLSGAWRTQLHLDVDGGVLQPESELRMSAPEAALRMKQPASDVTAEVALTLTARQGADILLDARVMDLKSQDHGPEMRRATAEVVIPSNDLTAEVTPKVVAASIDELRAPRLEWFESWLGKESLRLSGRGKLDLEWKDPSPEQASGNLELGLDDASVRTSGSSFAGSASIDVELGRETSEGASVLRLHPLEIGLSNAKLTTAESRTEAFSARIRSRSSRWLRDHDPQALQGTFDIHLKPVEALLPLVMAGAPAAVTDVLMSLDALDARLAVFLSSKLKRVELLQAGTGAIDAEGAWQEQASGSEGAFLLNTWLVNLGVEVNDGKTEFEVGADKPFLKRAP